VPCVVERVEPNDVVEAAFDPEASDRVPQHGGMSLQAEVAVPAHEWRRLVRICRYVARLPLVSERLALCPNNLWRDGTTHILMERSELIERLVPLIPPPRDHQARYHGILAQRASMRDQIVLRQAARRYGTGVEITPVPGIRARTQLELPVPII